MITGKDIIDLGFLPGKWFKDVVEYANLHNLQGDALKEYILSARPTYIEARTEPIEYYMNIRAENEEETNNIQLVISSMNELMKTPTLVAGAIMPDACPTAHGQIPVGGIAVAKNAIHPAMHSADVCCSVMMSNIGFISPKKVLDIAQSVTHFGGGGRDDFSHLPKNLEDTIKQNNFLKSERSMHVASHHLATQGDGNHFLFVGMSKKTGETIIVTHHGSRGFGAILYEQGMKTAEIYRKEISPTTAALNAWIPYDTNDGKEYWQALQIVREWTKLNHTTIHNAIIQTAQAELIERFWNEHNFVFKKDDLFYHAKGATPLDDAFVPDSYKGLRLIPLNMSEPILIVKGETTARNLGFAPHGAGRNISRGQHKKSKIHSSIDTIFKEETKGIDIRFFSNDIDIAELPSAYKNADTVKKQMQEFGLGTIVDEIIPYGCIMAGDWKLSAPWKGKKKNRKF